MEERRMTWRIEIQKLCSFKGELYTFKKWTNPIRAIRFDQEGKYKNNWCTRRKKKKREKGAESLFKEIIAENFPNHGQNWNIQVHEANRTGISMQKDHFLDTL